MTTDTNVKNIIWEGSSGNRYKYWIYPIDTSFKSVPGNYIFAKETRPGTHTPIYAGETSDLSERFDNHHKMLCIKRNGATHIHVHKSDISASTRRAEEADIIRKWNPTCNG
jgi:hypothetical protein